MTSRCDVPVRVQRAELIARDVRIMSDVAPLLRGADGAARHPYRANTYRRCPAGDAGEIKGEYLSTYLPAKHAK
jgi:hypothetical protein